MATATDDDPDVLICFPSQADVVDPISQHRPDPRNQANRRTPDSQQDLILILYHCHIRGRPFFTHVEPG